MGSVDGGTTCGAWSGRWSLGPAPGGSNQDSSRTGIIAAVSVSTTSRGTRTTCMAPEAAG
jgi:hypothetical protein